MAQHLILTLLIANAINLISGEIPEGLNLKEVYEYAEAKLEADLMMRTLNGATSKKENSRRRSDSYSMEMTNRNALFKDMTKNLKTEFKLKEGQARALAKQALVENRSFGSEEVTMMNKMCNGIEPVCENIKDKRFRTITGQCNNLNVPYWGSFEHPFQREIGVGFYNPLTDIELVDSELLEKDCKGPLSKVGDGHCDNGNDGLPNLNTIDCNFDGGDCCGLNTEPVAVDGVRIDDGKCVRGPMPVKVTTDAQATETDCDIGWHSIRDVCYYFGDENLKVDAALTTCKDKGGRLWEPRNGADFHAVITVVKDVLKDWSSKPPRFRIGIIRDVDEEGKFIFYSNEREITFSKWQNGQPDNFRNRQDCVVINAIQNQNFGMWNDIRCRFDAQYICEKDGKTKIQACTEKNLAKVNNGVCNDEANTVECHYDGGDCCQETMDTSECDFCLCLGGGEGRNNADNSMCPERTHLPSPRTISNSLNADVNVPSTLNTHMVAQFGQFLDHDIALTPEPHGLEHCCPELDGTVGENEGEEGCYNLWIRSSDHFYAPRGLSCLNVVVRTNEYCKENQVWYDNTTGLVPRQQFNQDTHFIDSSNVYGNNVARAKLLRSNQPYGDPQDGMGQLEAGTHNLLPTFNRTGTFNNTEALFGKGNGIDCDVGCTMASGDVRATEMPGLASMHTLMFREHNRLAKLIKEESDTNSLGFKDEEIYQHARRMTIAQWQSIVYGEYLPVVLGTNNLAGIELPETGGTTYNSGTNPTMAHEFTTAAYRFGHSMIQGIIRLYSTDHTVGFEGQEYALHTQNFKTGYIERNNGQGLENILMGLMNEPAQSFDKFVTDEMTDFLFFYEDKTDHGRDIVALNILRGRDHGLPGFCCYYKLHQNQDFDCNSGWEKRYEGFSVEDWEELQMVYAKPSDIDLFAGGLMQKPEGFLKADGTLKTNTQTELDDIRKLEGLTGKVFNTIKAEQFKRSKNGDRFFFTHTGERGSFTEAGRTDLKNRKLGHIICDNTKITAVPQNAFLLDLDEKTKAQDVGKFMDCKDSPQLNVATLLEFEQMP